MGRKKNVLPFNPTFVSTMPLRVFEAIEPSSLKEVPENYLIFYSSISESDGKLWCPDCVAVDSTVRKIFGPDGPAALIVYVGQKAEWKTPNNPFRSEPWNIQSIPTIIKLRDFKETSRLVESEINGGLASFVQE